MAELLSDDEIDAQFGSDRERDSDEIVRVYELDDCLDGVAFAASVGKAAEEKFHRPEITIRYQEVEIRLTNYEEGGITDKDLRPVGLFDGEP